MLFSKNAHQRKPYAARVVAVTLATAMSAAAFASKVAVQDRRVSMAQAEALAKQAKSESGFPIVVNDLVLNELNRFVGTPDGREYVRNALARMDSYRGMIETKLDQYGLPHELLAIPLVESCYQNLPDENHQGHGAGLWMFIKSTAKNFGLRVDSQIDQRLDTALETDAGCRYLSALNLQFKDWLLAVFSYNVGESTTEKGIEAVGSRDVWKLIQNGYENDNHYLARVMAAVIVMKNPSVLQ